MRRSRIVEGKVTHADVAAGEVGKVTEDEKDGVSHQQTNSED